MISLYVIGRSMERRRHNTSVTLVTCWVAHAGRNINSSPTSSSVAYIRSSSSSNSDGLIHCWIVQSMTKVTNKSDIAVRNRNYHIARENYMPYGITQCYLPSDSGIVRANAFVIFYKTRSELELGSKDKERVSLYVHVAQWKSWCRPISTPSWRQHTSFE